MIDSEKVFFDTSPFIYLLENHPKYYYPVAEFISNSLIDKESKLVTSVITVSEFLVKLKKDGNDNIIKDFETLLKELKFEIRDINYDIAVSAAGLKSRYNFLKAFDALQIAAAINANCICFLTNDKQLQ